MRNCSSDTFFKNIFLVNVMNVNYMAQIYVVCILPNKPTYTNKPLANVTQKFNVNDFSFTLRKKNKKLFFTISDHRRTYSTTLQYHTLQPTNVCIARSARIITYNISPTPTCTTQYHLTISHKYMYVA